MFCGVHFMAESADVLTGDHQQVLLPDLNAGCSMADMADIDQVEEAWDDLARVVDVDRAHPGHLHELRRRAQGLRRPPRRRGVHLVQRPGRPHLGPRRAGERRVLFFPDQHLGRNTGYELGYGADDMAVWNPRQALGGLSDREVKESTLLLWKGHCSVHQRFRPEHVEAFRAEHPDGIVMVHPECAHEVVELGDVVGSTDAIIRAVDAAPSGAVIGVATEIHLVKRLDDESPDKTVVCLDPLVCPCSTMSRIDPPAPGLGARGSGRRRGAQPDHRRRRHRRVGQGGARAHARHHLSPPGVDRSGRVRVDRPQRPHGCTHRPHRPGGHR